ncbi:MAG: prolyl oligopeptidase family serine peptidase, partial [Rubricoccaceae bacterium]
WRSTRDGFAHLYLYRNDGTPVGQVTRGDWDVTTFHGVDERTGFVYVTTTAAGPRERHLYRVPLPAAAQTPAARRVQRGRPATPERLTHDPGWHTVQLSADYGYFLSTYSTATEPPTTALFATSGRTPGARVATLVDNAPLRERLARYALPAPEFMTVPGADGTPLEAYLIRPRDFDPSRQYPLLIHTYGGPGSQVVRDRWEGNQRLWHHYLADTYGILVAGVDNRGSGGRGWAFKTATQNRLGILEAQDQTAAARYFGALPFVDERRLGIWGWSYGGYLSLLSALYGDGPETFRVAVAVAPVTNWRQYDTIYTERYLSTPQKNPAGYDAGSPVTYAANLREHQRVLLIHGDADDNVHVQNTLVMADAFQAAGKPFDMMLYPGRDHGIFGGRTRLHLFSLLTRYVAEHLAGQPFSASN